MKTLYMDCFCGISGDMAAGALIDAGADATSIEDAVRSLPIEGVSVVVEQVIKRGIRSVSFRVVIDRDVKQPQRHLPHIIDIIHDASLPESVTQGSIQTFELLGAAEAEVHGIPIEKVHFHEVGAVDSIVDILAANLALHLLGIEEVLASRLVVGSGTVRCDHGVMPVPAPATAQLLRGIPWEAGDVAVEMVTPTGAALLRHWAAAFMPMPPMTVHALGYGAGTRDLSDRANVLRAFIGERNMPAPAAAPICVVETTIDDMNPELTALLIPAMIEAGARDAFITPVIAKKGRSAQCLTVLCDMDKTALIMRAIFAHSGTLGIRVREERRWTLERKIRCVATPWGTVDVKIGLFEGEVHSVAPEFESCRRAAEQHAVPVRRVYEKALTAALQGAFIT